MQVAAAEAKAPISIRTDLCAIFVSLELSRSIWLITSLSPGAGEKMSKHSVSGGDTAGLFRRFADLQQKARGRAGRTFSIISIQEAGLDGFWIHRLLEGEGIESWVVDPASILTSRRWRRAKTDKIDGETLVRTLLAYKRGEPRVCAMLRIPTPEEEDRRRICRELDRLEIILTQLKAVGSERDAMLEPAKEGPPTPASLLAQLKGTGPEFAAVLWSEGLFRSFNNRRQVAAYAGLAPTPWQSGAVDHEQGVSKAGNPRLRTTMIQLAWLWLRHQPDSALSLWFRERVQRNGGRGKKLAIVAMARKLLVALWKYAVHGVLIDGTKTKAA
jgi:transposase